MEALDGDSTMSLSGQVAIVTGGAQGIGREIALRLGQDGARVVVADINATGAEHTAGAIVEAGGVAARAICTDITDESQVAHLMEQAFALDNRIDILVNNAAIMGPVKNIEDITLPEWTATLAVNLTGIFLCCKHVLPTMKSQGRGSIVNVSSVTGKRPLPQRTPYAASKLGVIGLTRTLAAEVGQWKIRVNAVCPGAVTGARQHKVYEGIMKFSGKTRAQVLAERAELAALKTFVDPRDVAAVVAFLCSDDAAMMTGQDLNVSAGAVMY